MKHRLPPLSSLRAFDAASHRESFAEAARDLYVSQSAVSQQIKVLEDWLEVKLFERLGNRVALTKEGQALRYKVSEAFELLAEACEATGKSYEDISIQISAENAFATRWLRPRLTEFREANPDINIYLNLGWDQNTSQGSESDVIIHFEERFNESKYIVKRLFPIDSYPACSPDFITAHPGISEVSDICGLPLIHDNSRVTWRRWINSYLPGANSWETGYVYSDLSLALDAALDGEGIFLADDILCKQELESGALIRLFPETLRSTWYSIAISNEHASDPVISSFLDWITSTVENK
ncbi:LysR substrate-binding domain-containing protein [Neptunomonas sp.]|uniref:LysR substrate-binding domain-containing protein n=1 Tax=Neptunomonas sp. TaxID=1971898 RepID=UPI0035687AE3